MVCHPQKTSTESVELVCEGTTVVARVSKIVVALNREFALGVINHRLLLPIFPFLVESGPVPALRHPFFRLRIVF